MGWSVVCYCGISCLARLLFMDFFSVFNIMFDNFVWICNSISTGSLNLLGFKETKSATMYEHFSKFFIFFLNHL